MRALVLIVLLGACAVKGYDLGWRKDGRLTGFLGTPLDEISGCVAGPAVPAPRRACEALIRRVDAVLSGLPALAEAPVVLGARCRGDRCTYANVYERRDVGTALIVPVYKRIVLREARLGMVLDAQGWRIETVSIRDNAPPGYGPVRIGARPSSD